MEAITTHEHVWIEHRDEWFEPIGKVCSICGHEMILPHRKVEIYLREILEELKKISVRLERM